MAGQAGWYKAPGEDGLLRYWNGTEWTNHRQPVPEATAPPEPAPPIDDLDPMAEYERQFATPTSTDVVVAPSQLQYRPQAALTSAPVVPAPTPEFAGKSAAAPRSLGPIALGPVAPAATPLLDEPESEFDRMYREMSALAGSPTPIALAEASATTDLAVEATPTIDPAVEVSHPTEAAVEASPAQVEAPSSVTAPTAAGNAPNRKAVLGAFRIMAGAIIVILLGVAAMAFFSLANSVSAGDVKTNAIVTSLGATSGNSCTPIARFAVAGRSYTAKSSVAISPCPIGLGESVSVVYSAANPASAARIEVGSSATGFLWLIPIIGGLVFVGGLITFTIRAGSIVAGVALLRDRSEREPEATQEP
jgi:hypothetical protein